VKIWGQIPKIWSKYLKIRAKMAPNVVYFEKKWRPTIFGGNSNCVGEKSRLKTFWAIWRNSGKNLSHPQKFVCSCTYVEITENFQILVESNLQ